MAAEHGLTRRRAGSRSAPPFFLRRLGGELVGQSAAPEAQAEIHRAADEGGVVLMVHADTPERQAKAEELMQACGATKVWRQNTA